MEFLIGVGVGAGLWCLIDFIVDGVTISRAKDGHNDRDVECKFWWGDRSGYDLHSERCHICNPQYTT